MLKLQDFDFLDFGCTTGGKPGFLERLGAEKGLCLESDKRRVQKAIDAGADAAVVAIADRAAYDGKVRLSLIASCIERQPNTASAMALLDTAIHVSRTAVIVRQPWFGSEEALFALGLKLFWSDWKAHTAPLTSLNYYRMLAPMVERGSIARFILLGVKSITEIGDDRLLPLSAPSDSKRHDPAAHADKLPADLPAGVFAELVVIITIRNGSAADIAVNKFAGATKLFDSDTVVKPVAAKKKERAKPGTAPAAKNPEAAPKAARNLRLRGARSGS